jgi:hypothetical protein
MIVNKGFSMGTQKVLTVVKETLQDQSLNSCCFPQPYIVLKMLLLRPCTRR